MSEDKKQASLTATEAAQDLANTGREIRPDFQFIVVALNTKAKVVALASSHREKMDGSPFTDAEVEQLYRHFVLAEKLVGDLVSTLEHLMEERNLFDEPGKRPPEYRH